MSQSPRGHTPRHPPCVSLETKLSRNHDQRKWWDGPLAACALAALVGAEGSLAAMVDDLSEYPIRRESVRTDAKIGDY